jgi:hypothetical protein
MATEAVAAREPGDRRWFRILLMQLLAERALTQYRLATRAHLEGVLGPHAGLQRPQRITDERTLIRAIR